MAENPLALGSNAPLAVTMPLSEPAKLGHVLPLEHSSSLNQSYSSLDPAENSTQDDPVAIMQQVSPDAPQVVTVETVVAVAGSGSSDSVDNGPGTTGGGAGIGDGGGDAPGEGESE